jgi:hypothetical protein
LVASRFHEVSGEVFGAFRSAPWIAGRALAKLRVLRGVTALLRGAPCHFSLFSHGVSPWNAGFSNAQNRVTRNNIVVLLDDDRIDKPEPTNDCEQLVALFIRVRAAFRFVVQAS